ncbi:serine carboxypeptidase-like [Musa troglodytarum]|uniref:Serine carboxypeptidase-like n=1 Tax=Musa troglodytarum TaxID=320322 RepID=A0A9E7I212_9LILI|nr:serine carboxypeptidase-like [Musa troglodytarum]
MSHNPIDCRLPRRARSRAADISRGIDEQLSTVAGFMDSLSATLVVFFLVRDAALSTTGFTLETGQSKSLDAPAGWSGRLWARTLCATDSSGRVSCGTGDCGSGEVECSGGGATPPVTLAEFTLGGGSGGGMDYYDVSLVDGYNLPMLVVAQGGSGGGCGSTGCVAVLNRVCPSDLKVVAARSSSRGGEGVACMSACEAFGSPQYCCTGAFGNSNTCKPSSYSQFFKNACPRAYSYAFDDATSTFTCASAGYLITFCPSTASQKSSSQNPESSAGDGPTVSGVAVGDANAKKRRRMSVKCVINNYDDPAWHSAEVQDEDARETSNYGVAQECLDRLAIAIGGNTIVPVASELLPAYLAAPECYVNVNEAKDVQLFYYFIKSEREPEDDPLLVWLTGGPGCSALSGLIYEIGPLEFDVEGYTEGLLPTLFYKSTSWTKVSSIIFLDSPVGTGFSYSTSKRGLKTSDTKSSVDVHTFLRKWYVDHPSFIANPLYVAGDSYSGFTVPVVAQYIADGNEAGYGVHLNLKGYLLGNPCTDANYDGDARIPYAHGVGFISDELYESTKSSCGGKYQNPSNAECSRCVDSVNQDLSGINTAQILEPLCSSVETPKPNIITADGRRLLEALSELPMSNTYDPLCRNYGYLLSHAWANNDTVRQALGIREGSTQTWVRCDFGLNNYTYDVLSSVNYHFSLTNRGYRALVYSGDHDMTVPFLGTQAWIRSLNFSIVDDWRPWSVEGQVTGFTRTYSNNLTFATVKVSACVFIRRIELVDGIVIHGAQLVIFFARVVVIRLQSTGRRNA